MDKIERKIESLYNTSQDDISITKRYLSQFFIEDYFERVYEYLQNEYAGDDLENFVCLPLDGYKSEMQSLNEKYDDLILEIVIDKKIPQLNELFEKIMIFKRDDARRLKDIIYWTLTWSREDQESLDTWIVEVPNFFEEQLNEFNLLKSNEVEIDSSLSIDKDVTMQIQDQYLSHDYFSKLCYDPSDTKKVA